jgi:hypothetical protein
MLYGRDPGYAIGELEKVLGKLPDRVKHDYMGEQSRTHGDLTELLLSRASPVVTDQVTGLLLKTYVSPITTFLMPIRQLGPYESINFKWMEINFDQGLAPQVEVEGLARLYTHNKTRRGARAVRRGVAVKVEEGFFLTPEGRKEWGMQIEQLATIIQRTNEYDAFIALLQTPLRLHTQASDLGGAYNHIYGTRPGTSDYDRLLLNRDWFSIVNKAEDSKGFSNMVAQLRTTMKKQGIEPNALVVPPNLMSVYFGTSDDLWNYNSAGPKVDANRAMAEDIGPDNGIRTQTFQGLRVVDTYVQRSTVGGHEDAGDLLTIPKQIGEFYPMSTDHLLVEEDEIHSFRGKKRDIRIFNEDQSRIVPVAFEDAIHNCLRWDTNGKLDDARHNGATDDIFVKDNGNLVNKWGDVEKKWWQPDENDKSGISFKRVAQSIMAKFGPEKASQLNNDVVKFKSCYVNDAGVVPDDAPQTIRGADGASVDKDDPVSDDYLEALRTYADAFYQRVKLIVDRVGNNVGGNINEGTIKEFIASDYSPIELGVNAEWTNVLGNCNDAEKVALGAFLLSKVTRDNLKRLHRADVYLPIDFVLARPYMTYRVSSAIMMLAGRETGEIVVGQQRFQMTSNIGDRTLYANYFYYGRAIVYKERNVLIAPDVFIQNYVKGMNTAFINDDDLQAIHENSGLHDRTNSILAILTKAGDKTSDVNVMDIRGKNDNISIPGREGKPHFATSLFYDGLLRLDNHALSHPATDYSDYEDLNVASNSLCFLGHTENYRGEVLFQNTGHLGPHTYNGVNLSRKPGNYSAIRNNHAMGH